MSRGTENSPFSGEETEPFGTLLKERRESRGLSLDDAVVQTRIRRSFLEALEEDRFGDIPGETYVCGFLRTYAIFLGFDPEEVLASYHERFHKPSVSPSPTREEKGGKNPFIKHRWLLPVIFLVVVAVILTAVALQCSRSDSEAFSEPSPGSSGRVEESVSAGEAVEPPENAVEESGEIEGLPAKVDNDLIPGADLPHVVRSTDGPVVFVPAGGALLKAECRDTGWLEITVDDRPTQRYLLEPGAILKWRIGKTFHLETERHGLLTLWLDDQKVDLGERTALQVGPEPGSDVE